MEVKLIEVSDWKWVEWAFSRTTHTGHGKVKLTPLQAYLSEHSPIRERVFRFECEWPDYVHQAFTRHHVGVNHYVGTHRHDRGHKEVDSRESLRQHALVINAQELINMARQRLCFQATLGAREAMAAIRQAVAEVDMDLAFCMVPDCIYRRRCCQPRPCGNFETLKTEYAEYFGGDFGIQ